jgi:serine/threonine-protein kinase
MIGKTLSHYRITEKIGAGGMGEVYKAHDERLDRDVAVKVLPSGTLADEHARKRFRKEALTLSKLNHPHIATVFDFDTQDGVDFIAMELVEGASLGEKLKTGALPEREISELGGQIADALEEAHEKGVVHRDLKPGNIALTPKGRVKVLDFGLARMLRPVSDEASTEALSETHAVVGTMPYMSPEELRGERADHRSDIYSLGVVLYEVAAGRRPFDEKLPTRLTDAILHQAPEPPSTHNGKISTELESCILKALDKDPERRYQSAREIRVDLERLAAPVPLVAPKLKRTAQRLIVTASVVAIVAVAAALGFLILGDGEAPEIDSIAVLPLDNLSGDPEQEYFSDGMHEALISNLAKIGALRVISRQSVMRFKDEDTPLPEIARLLNVDAVVEGSVLCSGNRVRITAQLVQAYPERHLWAESYERDLQDILSLQNEVAREITTEIRVAVTPDERVRLSTARPVDPQVTEAYLKGLYQLRELTPGQAIPYFEEAIVRDPQYAPAYVGLSSAYTSIAWGESREPLPADEALEETVQSLVAKSRTALKKALRLDDSLSTAHTLLGWLHFLADCDYAGAEKEFVRAIELNPSDASAHHGYGLYLTTKGMVDEGIAEISRAVELDPVDVILQLAVAGSLFSAGRYDEAIQQLHKVQELAPDYAFIHVSLGNAYAQKGMFEEAFAAYNKAMELGGEPLLWMPYLSYTYASAGQRSEALKVLEELSKRVHVPPITYAIVHTGLGNTDEALEYLEKALEECGHGLYTVRRNPYFDPLRDDARFQDLLRRMNFPE